MRRIFWVKNGTVVEVGHLQVSFIEWAVHQTGGSVVVARTEEEALTEGEYNNV